MKIGILVLMIIGIIIGLNLRNPHTPTNDGFIVIGFDSEPRTIDPRMAVDANSQYIEGLLHCSLISFSPTGDLKGDLANSWKWLDDTTIVFTIDQHRKYNDGSFVKPNDVIATFQAFSEDKLDPPSPRASSFRNIKKIQASSEGSTVTFSLHKPDASFITNLPVGILPERLAQGPLLENVQDMVGCGPYTLKEKNIGELILHKNPHFNGQDAPVNEGLIIKIVKSESTRFAKLKKGELDIVQNSLNHDSIKSIAQKHKNLQVTSRPGLRTTYLGFNMKDPLAGDVHVRKAISLAIDRDKIIEYIFAGMAIPARTILPPDNSFFFKDLKNHEFNIDEAKKILDAAGYKDPDGDGPKTRFNLSYKTTTDITRINIAKAIASQLGKIGIGIEVQPLEWGKFKSDIEAGRVQVWSLAWIGFKDPDIYRYAFASENVPPNGPNRGWYSNPRLDQLLQEASQVTDIERRRTLYQRVQEIIQEDLPYVFLWHEESFAVTNKDIHGFELYADGRLSSLTKVNKKK